MGEGGGGVYLTSTRIKIGASEETEKTDLGTNRATTIGLGEMVRGTEGGMTDINPVLETSVMATVVEIAVMETGGSGNHTALHRGTIDRTMEGSEAIYMPPTPTPTAVSSSRGAEA